MNESQLNSLERLRKEIPPETDPEILEWCTDANLCRYLRARDWDHDKTLFMLKNSLQWRATYKPHKITAEEVVGELKNKGKMYRGGYDRYGRPILYMKPRYDNTGANEREQKVRYLCYLLEKCHKAALKKDKEKIVLVIDFKDNNQLSNLSNIKVSQEVLGILQDHYPETLGVAFITNAPWAFSFFISCMYPFMHPITKSKIKMVSSNKDYLQVIDPEQLEVDYGGALEFKYDFDQHWNKEDLEFPNL
uniref:CRAL-TRIO domain-containing protein n=1 Tax=Arcella intermedia TaxID=1963864 RepID=A0A6B2LES2_9EUKA